jgi:signal transduction histidine kinase
MTSFMLFLAKHAKHLLFFIAFLGIWTSVFIADVALSKEFLKKDVQQEIQNIEAIIDAACGSSNELNVVPVCDFDKLLGSVSVGDISIISRDEKIVYASHEVKTNDLIILEDSNLLQRYFNNTSPKNRSDLYQTSQRWKGRITLAKISNSRLPDFSNDKHIVAKRLSSVAGCDSCVLVIERPYYKDEFWVHILNKAYLLPIAVLLSIFFMLIEAHRLLINQHLKKTKKYAQDLGSFIKTEQVIPPVPTSLSTDKDFEKLGESIRNLRKKLELKEVLSHDLEKIGHQLTGYMAGGAGWLEVGTNQAAIDKAIVLIQEADELLKELLNIANLNATDPKNLNKEVTSINDLINKAISKCEQKSQEKNLVIRFNPPLNGIPLRGEKSLLVETFKNILNNAYSASPRGSTIIIKLDKVGPCVRVRVLDEGPGLTDREIDNIDAAAIFTGKPGGHGLGLRFVKTVLNLHDGEFSIKNRTMRKGAEATISFRQKSDLHQAQGHTLAEPPNYQNINELPAYRPLPSEEEKSKNKNTIVRKENLVYMIALSGSIYFLLDTFMPSVSSI